MLTELQTVALTRDFAEYNLLSGDIGTIVHVHAGDAFEVEFARADGLTVAVLTLQSNDLRPLEADILHARRLAS